MSRANFKLSFSERKLSPEIEPLAISKLSLSAKELGPEPKYSHIRPLLAAAPPFIADYFLQKSERYYDGFRISFFSHFLVLILTIVKMAFFPTQSLTYFPSLRVDMVGLPDILKKDLENISKNSPAKKQIEEALKKADLEIAKLKIEKKNSKNPEEIVPKDEMAIKTAAKAREKKLKNAIDRIKALSKIQKQTHPEDPQLTEDPDLLEDAGKRSAVIKGNRLSKGSSLTAEARES